MLRSGPVRSGTCEKQKHRILRTPDFYLKTRINYNYVTKPFITQHICRQNSKRFVDYSWCRVCFAACTLTRVLYFQTKAKQKETKSNFGLQFTICVFQFTV